jgi:hypothetical protein
VRGFDLDAIRADYAAIERLCREVRTSRDIRVLRDAARVIQRRTAEIRELFSR